MAKAITSDKEQPLDGSPLDEPTSGIPLALFVGSYLSYSETFIYEQLKHQKAFNTMVFAYRLNPHADKFPYTQKICLSTVENALYQVMGMAPSFTRSLQTFKAKLVHAHFGPNGVLATAFAKKNKLPLVVTFHGHDVAGLLKGNKYTLRYFRYNLFARRMFTYASLIIASSRELSDMLIQQVGVPSNKVVVHPLGVDLKDFTYVTRQSESLSILMIGRFVEKKGFVYGIRAFAKLLKQQPDLQLNLVGAGPLLQEYQILCQQLGIENSVNFKGILSAEAVRNEMNHSDILLVPSVVARDNDRESGVIVIKEAFATGLPVVGTLHGGIPDIIESGKTGFLVPEKDVPALTESLAKLIKDNKLRQDFGMQARKTAEEKYDSLKQNQKLEQLFLDVLNG